MTYPKEIIKEIYRSLPDEIVSVVESEEIIEKVSEIARSNNLGGEQKDSLGDEIMMRVIGVTQKVNFTSNIEARLGVTADVAQKIADEVGEKILSNIPSGVLEAQEEYTQVKLKETAPLPPVNISGSREKLINSMDNSPVSPSRSINLISPPAPERKPLDLLPPNLPTAPEKPKEVEVMRHKPAAYPGGVDPYREPTN
ncbi:hypothetical protein KW796_02480 [Candidatus Parcubacteria bacterium]|nr:hypothetical protein [Candidatus Parcubacteria bacterium]